MDKSVDKKPIYICLICFIIALVSGFFILYQPLQKWAICKIGYSDAAKPPIRTNGNRLSGCRKPQRLLMLRSRLSGVA